jgi:hypothetical protein
MRELSAPMSRLFAVLAATLALSASPASAQRFVNEFVRAKCDSDTWSQTVSRYDDGSPGTSSEGTGHGKLRIALRDDYEPRTVNLEVRWHRERGEPLAATSYSYLRSDGTGDVGTAEGVTSLEVRLHLGKRVIRLRRRPDWSESRLRKKGDDNHAHPVGLADFWELSIPLGLHLGKLRRHEARGGKTRVSLHYAFPRTTTVETVNIESHEGVIGQWESTNIYSAFKCSAKSRPGTLTRG